MAGPKPDPGTTELLLRLTKGRDIQARAAAAQRIVSDAATIRRLRYSLTRCRDMAENAAYRIGQPGVTIGLASLQQGFTDIQGEAAEGLNATTAKESTT